MTACAEHTIVLRVNGCAHTLTVAPRHTLLHVLRAQLGLTGAKQGCGTGECGACNVLLNGEVVVTCLVLAVEADGAEIETVEGLAQDGAWSVLQEAFHEHGGTQCGFCAPGMLMAATALLRQVSRPDESEIRAALAGNLCRCGSYADIIKAVQAASRARR